MHEVIDFVQTATSLDINSVKSTGKVLVFAMQKKNLVLDNGFTQKLETVVSVKMLDRAIAYGAFWLPTSVVKADSNGMMMTSGLILDPKTIHFDLKLSSKKEIYINRSLLKVKLVLPIRQIKQLKKLIFLSWVSVKNCSERKFILSLKFNRTFQHRTFQL